MPGERVRAGGVHAYQPVGLGPRVGRGRQTVVFGFGTHPVPRVADRLLVQGRDPQAQHGFLHAGMGGHAAEDRLALTVGVARVDQFVHLVGTHQSDQFAVPLRGSLGAGQAPPPLLRVDGQRVHGPFARRPRLALVAFRLVQFDQMALRPRHHDASREDIPVATVRRGVQRLRDRHRDGTFLRYDQSQPILHPRKT